MPVDEPRALATEAEQAAARKFNLELLDGTIGFYDATHRSNGRKVQVKSALYRRGSGDPGRFRVWRSHLEKLRDHSGSVVVVVRNPANPVRTVLKVEKVSPQRLLDRADWRESRQSDMAGKAEARIPWPDVVTL